MAASRGRLTTGVVLGAVVALAVLMALGIGAYLLGYLPLSQGAAAGNARSEADAAPPSPGPQQVLKERIINLADSGGHRYVKIGLTLEFAWEAAEARRATPDDRKRKEADLAVSLEPWMPVIDDQVIALVSARTVADLSTPEGKQKLKSDIKEKVNQLLGGERVANVLFTQFVMQ